ncbi:MAG TPA: hypothetical protein VLG67_02870 [Candidatus Saccharimonadales bacterium]|nr:hypothetical protein [Candidatus Saccharimonadales bacterium]
MSNEKDTEVDTGIDGNRNLVIKREDPFADLDPNAVGQLIYFAAHSPHKSKGPPVTRININNRNRNLLILKSVADGIVTLTTFSIYRERGLPPKAAIYTTTSPNAGGQDPTVSPPKYHSLEEGRKLLRP